jgi:hypothetical protein
MNIPNRMKYNFTIQPAGERRGRKESRLILNLELDGEPVHGTIVICGPLDHDDVQEFYDGEITLQTLREKVSRRP